jgi:putative transposase
MRFRAYKYRIYPNKVQATAIRKACGCRRFIYNWGLEQKQQAYQRGEKLTCIDLSNRLPGLKKELPWLKTDAYSQSLQTTMRDLDMAFTRFFKKQGDYPRFKSKGKSRESFHVPQGFKIGVEEGALTLPKLGKVRVIFDRDPDGEFKSVTVSMSKSGKFFASILCEQDVEDPELKPIDPKTTIGVDVGIKTFLVCSDGRKFENPKHLRESMSRLKFLSRRHARKQKGGKNRERARLRLARQHEKVANQRRDFLHKVSHELANESQVGTICVEDLNVKGMMKNHCLAGAISDCSWGAFFRMLEYKCRWRGIRIVKIGRFEPSSKLCPCGVRNDGLTLADREWTCPKCGTVHDRDLLAANNVKRFGIAKATLTAGGTPVESLGSCSVATRERRTRKPGL